jgi:glyoxylase-like metal-dependent hydrolase (beta-lactamase superfamily II)
MHMENVAGGVRLLDLNFRGRPRVIATGVIETPAGLVLVDPGPPSCVDELRAGLNARGARLGDVHALLLTHIHLDHAAAAGPLVRENPSLRVFVHERGAPHVIDPSKLLASATRLYGDEMEALWGRILPVPASSVTALAGGEVLDFGGRVIDVADTPGHAYHHVAYFDRTSAVAFMGDTGGVRAPHARLVVPPTPPPDIDPVLWHSSVETVRRWGPSHVFITHFGAYDDVTFHLDDLLGRLDRYSELASRIVVMDGDDGAREARFVEQVRNEIRGQLGDEVANDYRAAIQFEHCWQGLARYWRRRSAL